MREMTKEHITNSTQRFRMQTMRARWSSLDQYINRNLVMIERGTHPKMKFRANLRDRERQARAWRSRSRRLARNFILGWVPRSIITRLRLMY